MAETIKTPEELLAEGWHLGRGYLKATPSGPVMVQTWIRGEEKLEITEEGAG